MYIASMV